MGLKINVRNFFCNYLPAVETTIYIVPAGRAAIIKGMVIVNETGNSRSLNVRVVRGNSHARMVPYNFTLGAFCMACLSETHTLEAGDRIFAACDQQLSVTMKLSGVEEVIP